MALCCTAAAFSTSAIAQSPARLNCATGPAYRDFGGVKWLVYACDDGGSVVLVAPEESAAAPYHFLLQDQAGGYVIYGDGNGSRTMSEAAKAEIAALSQAQIGALATEARRAVSASR